MVTGQSSDIEITLYQINYKINDLFAFFTSVDIITQKDQPVGFVKSDTVGNQLVKWIEAAVDITYCNDPVH